MNKGMAMRSDKYVYTYWVQVEVNDSPVAWGLWFKCLKGELFNWKDGIIPGRTDKFACVIA